MGRLVSRWDGTRQRQLVGVVVDVQPATFTVRWSNVDGEARWSTRVPLTRLTCSEWDLLPSAEPQTIPGKDAEEQIKRKGESHDC